METLTKKKYNDQKSGAKKRGIGFNLTYEEWCDIWIQSGKAHLRGHGKGKYCMGRHGDTGPYEIGNVSIISHEQNNSDGHKGKKKPGISKARKGKPLSANHRQKIGESQIGRKHSEETKQKMREAALRRYSKTTI